MNVRCAWVREHNPVYVQYHDTEWGVPVHDENTFFEFIVLESAQAGLSWETILRKRDGYASVYMGFVPERVAHFGQRDIEQLMHDERIVRNRSKITASIQNARAFLSIQREYGSFDAYIWAWVQGVPVVHDWKSIHDIPAYTELSKTLARDLAARGFSFFGPRTCYAFMQACGLVNDHTLDCFRHHELCG